VLSVDPYRGSYVNLARTRARGAELSFEAAPTRHFRCRADYTFLDGAVVTSPSELDPVYAVGRPLLRRPRHQGSLSASGERGRLGAGMSLVLVGRRADSDFAGLDLMQNGGYARLDARVRLRLAKGLEAFAVAYNLLDADYQEVLGYPALGRALRLGLRFDGRERRAP
jgi:outer membrane receptor protein involved in Fe transport